MKTRTISILLLYFFVAFSIKTANAQDKKPEAIPDFYNVVAWVRYPFEPILNDIVDLGHAARIFQVVSSPNSTVTFNDSMIHYQSSLGFYGIDTIRYRIKDQQNGLISDLAKITINVSNHAFDSLDINNIRLSVNPTGSLFNSFYPYVNDFTYEFPKGSQSYTFASMGLNLAGINSGVTEYISGSTYLYEGMDFYPGPVTSSEYHNKDLDSAWMKVWKLSKAELQIHIQNYNKNGYEMPPNIRYWPANGKITHGQSAVLAPFHDFNDNGYYDPENGDYPLIRGDQAAYFVYNDIRYPHKEFMGLGMGAEVHCMVYAFNSADNEAINNTVFVNFMIYNRSQIVLNELKPGFFSNVFLGYWGDNFAGCDPDLNMGYYYNGDDYDEESESGYGFHPPAQSIKILNRKLTGFIPYYTNPSGWSIVPNLRQGLIQNMNGNWLDGSPLMSNGCGHPSCAQGDTVSYIYTGDPSLPGSWSEWQQGNTPGERGSMLLVEPVYDFRPGDAVCIDLALTTAREMNGNHIDSFVLLKEYAAQIQAFYNDNFPASCFDVAPGFDEIKSPDDNNQLILYPNPVDEVVSLKSSLPLDSAEYRIFDVTGRLKISGRLAGNQNQTIDVSMLKSGLYFVQLRYSDKSVTSKLIKK